MTPDKVALGQMLFFDPRLSGSGAISCASCHNPALGWGDAMPKGLGHMGGRLRRHTPTILNVAYGEPYFWDGRAATLEDQAKGPLTSAAEMNMPAEVAVTRIQSIPGYVTAFAHVFPGQPASTRSIAERVSEISSSTRSVAQNIHDAENTAGTTEQLSTDVVKAAEVMDEQAARLGEQVAQFILQLRTDNTAATPVPSATREYATEDLSLRRVTAA